MHHIIKTILIARLGQPEFHAGPRLAAVGGPRETAVRSGPDAALGIAGHGGDHVREEVVAAELREALPLSGCRRRGVRRRQRGGLVCRSGRPRASGP